MKVEQLGGLKVRLTGGTDGRGGGDGPVVVLLHGFGASGDDLVPLGQEIDVPPGTRFVFPEGPLFVDAGFGRFHAWWMLDVDRLARDLAAGRPSDLPREFLRGMSEAGSRIVTLLDGAERRLGADPKKTVLGGFSQGAMLACDVALRTARPFAGLVLLSGTLLAADEWVPLMPKRRGLRVLQSHGNADPLLPFFLAERLRDLLTKAGLTVDWVGFRGGHEVPGVVLDNLGGFLRAVLAR